MFSLDVERTYNLRRFLSGRSRSLLQEIDNQLFSVNSPNELYSKETIDDLYSRVPYPFRPSYSEQPENPGESSLPPKDPLNADDGQFNSSISPDTSVLQSPRIAEDGGRPADGSDNGMGKGLLSGGELEADMVVEVETKRNAREEAEGDDRERIKNNKTDLWGSAADWIDPGGKWTEMLFQEELLLCGRRNLHLRAWRISPKHQDVCI